MSDPLAVALARLAPTVDLAASRELFERSRDGDHAAGPGLPEPRRRWLLAAACVLLTVAGAVGVWAMSGRDSGTAPAVPPDTAVVPANGDEFRVVAVEPVGDFDRRAIAVASTRDELDRLLGDYRDDFGRYAAAVDFTTEIAVVVERPDNSCPLELGGFEPTDGTWRIMWAPKGGGSCDDVGLGWVYLVAIPRDALAGVDAVVLPGERIGETTSPDLVAPITGDDPRVGPVLVGFEDGGIDGAVPAQGISAYTQQSVWDDFASDEFSGSAESRIDLGTYVVVVVRRASDSGCPGDFDRFEVSGDVWTPTFTDVQPGCEDGAITTAHAIGVLRSALPDEVTFGLPEGPGLRAASVTVQVREPSSSRTTPPFTGTSLDATVLLDAGIASAEPRPGAVGFATSPQEYDVLWETFGGGQSRPDADLTSDVVLAFAFDDGGCAALFDGLRWEQSADRARLVAQLHEAEAVDCAEPVPARLIVVAFDPDEGLPPTFDFVVPRPYAPDVSTPLSLASSGIAWDVVVETVAPLAEPGSIWIANERTALEPIWDAVGAPVAMPAIDFSGRIAVVMVVEDETCRAGFEGFDPGPGDPHPVWTARFDALDGACDPSRNVLVTVAVERSAIPDGLTVTLPATQGYGAGERLATIGPMYTIRSTEWQCGPTDAWTLMITVGLPVASEVTVEVLDGGEQVALARVQNADVGDWVTVGVVPEYARAPSPDGEIVVTDDRTGDVVLRQPFDHTDRPEGLSCG